jgi:RNA polymerase sigma factor (sigma-70 family)
VKAEQEAKQPHAKPHDAHIVAHLPTVDALTKRLAGGRHDFEDLRSLGYLALVRAAAAFRPEKGVSFSAYLHLQVRWAILKGLRSDRKLNRADARLGREDLDSHASFSGACSLQWGQGEDEVVRREETRRRARLVVQLLDGLTPSERSVVVAHHLDGRDLKDLVRSGGPSYATVRRRAKSAMDQMRSHVLAS